ncbi:hypothetical protein E4U41_000392 [Claviceps citrina]|nr:hypothetical protein E4U41_000392 [Claviceps citrina]
MLEDKLRLLLRKGSLTSRTQRIFFVLLVLAATLIGYHLSFTSRETWTDMIRDHTTSQLGMHPDLHDEQARIGKLFVMYGNSQRHYERGMQSHKRHNRQHGYPMFIQRVQLMDGFWNKPAFVQYMVLRELRKPESERLQWLFWFDADTIVLNYNVPLEILLPPQGDKELERINVLVAEDWNGLNCGVYGIRVTRSAVELLADIMAYPDFEPDTELPFAEQSAMSLLLQRRKFINHFAKIPQRWFNSYPHTPGTPETSWVQPGDFLLHFAGVGNRDFYMNHWADESEALGPKWNVPLANTTYPEETKRFWEGVKSTYKVRTAHWANGTKHLQASMDEANKLVTEWTNTSYNSTDKFSSLLKAQETAKKLAEESKKYEDDLMDEDLEKLGKMVLELEDASKAFSAKSSQPKMSSP